MLALKKWRRGSLHVDWSGSIPRSGSFVTRIRYTVRYEHDFREACEPSEFAVEIVIRPSSHFREARRQFTTFHRHIQSRTRMVPNEIRSRQFAGPNGVQFERTHLSSTWTFGTCRTYNTIAGWIRLVCFVLVFSLEKALESPFYKYPTFDVRIEFRFY